MEKIKLTDVVNALLMNRDKYKSIPIKEKEKNFFIINRFLSKKYPEQAQKLNIKNIDKSLALDLWFIFLRHENRYEIKKWFWLKNNGSKNVFKLTNNDYKLLMEHLDVKKEDIDMFCMYNSSFITEELSYIKKLNKQNK